MSSVCHSAFVGLLENGGSYIIYLTCGSDGRYQSSVSAMSEALGALCFSEQGDWIRRKYIYVLKFCRAKHCRSGGSEGHS